jgi:site-specific DNA recombinase
MATRRKAPKAAGNRAVIYARVSTDEQVEEGVSLADQEARLGAYCVAHGLSVVSVVVEPGESAGKPLASRPGGTKVLALVKRKVVDAVVVAKLDRAFRNVKDALDTVDSWDKAGVALHIIDMGGQSVDTQSAMGRMFFVMAAGFAEMERRLTAERTTAAMAHMARSGNMRLGKHPPFGWKYSGSALVEVPEEQAAIVRAKVLRATGATLAGIAAELAKYGHRSRAGSRFAASQIQRMLDGSVRQMHAAG